MSWLFSRQMADIEHEKIDGPCQRSVCDIHPPEEKETWYEMSDNKVEAAFHTGEKLPDPEVEKLESDPAYQEAKEAKDSLPATHVLSMSAHVRTPEEFERIWLYFQHNSAQMGRILPYVSVSSELLDGDEPGVDEEDPRDRAPNDSDLSGNLYHDDQTLERVKRKLVEVLNTVRYSGQSDDRIAGDMIGAMLNAGILFRERP